MDAKTTIVSTNWCLVSVSAITIAARFYTRSNMPSNKNPLVDYIGDTFVGLSWFSFLGLAIATQLFADTGFFDPDQVDDDTTSYQLKLNYVINVMIWPCLYFIKFAMLCFFDRIISKSLFRTSWYAIRVIGAISIIAFLYTEGTTIFWCWPVSLNWNLDSECQTRSNIYVDRSTWGLHMATDFLIYAIGFSFLKELPHLPLREKLGVASMFALGFVGIIVSALAYWAPGTYVSVFVYRAIEQASLIVIACIPSLRFLINRAIGQQRLKSANNTKNSTYATAVSTFAKADDLNFDTKWVDDGKQLDFCESPV